MAYFLLNFFQTIRMPRLRVWQKIFDKRDFGKSAGKREMDLPPVILSKNKVRVSRLAELSLIVDTGGVYQGEKEPPGSKNELL